MPIEIFSSEALSSLRIEGGLISPSIVAKAGKCALDRQKPEDYRLPPGERIEDAIGKAHGAATEIWGRLRKGLGDESGEGEWWRDPNQSKIEPVLLGNLLKTFGFFAAGMERTVPDEGADEGADEPIWKWSGNLPIFLSPPGVALDERLAKTDAAGKRLGSRSAYERAQELCNRRDDIEWAAALDRRTLRLTRDNRTLTRPAFIEIDLEAMLSRKNASEFKPAWLLCHATRFEGKAGSCAMDEWIAQGLKDGERALDQIAEGIRDAIEALGSGFLEHRSNAALISDLESGRLSSQGFYEQLLRLAYRMIFLAVAEERSDEEGTPLIFRSKAEGESDTSHQAKVEAYLSGLSLSRLRSMAYRGVGSDGHEDLWRSLRLGFQCFASGEERLAIGALGGLFSPSQCPDLEPLFLSNARLLKAVGSMTQFQSGKATRLVNWRDIGSEEIGGVYERLLGLSPQISTGERTFQISAGVKGNARKLSASFYTPSSLVDILIGQTLRPTIEGILAPASPEDADSAALREQALLGLTVCDPACGSGHFLLAAARSIANSLARVRCGGASPSIASYRTALHDVATRCVFGVDKNPMAIELAKTSLWLESYARNRPLSFVDHHLIVGDALLGSVSPKALAKGIPQDAYKPLEGDDKPFLDSLKQRNKNFLSDLETLFSKKSNSPSPTAKKPKAAKTAPAAPADPRMAILLQALSDTGKPSLESAIESLAAARLAEFQAQPFAVELDHIPDQSIDDVQRKNRLLADLRSLAEDSNIQKAFDLYSAAFLARKTNPSDPIPTSEDLLFALAGADAIGSPLPVLELAAEIRRERSLLHWPIAFPSVFGRENPGFDVMLGNPPWEKIKISEKEWFSGKNDLIANAATQKRRALIAALATGSAPESEMLAAFSKDKSHSESALAFCLKSGRFPLTGHGDLNLYSAFSETFLSLLREGGKAGIIVPTGIATDDSGKEFFSHIANGRLLALFDFENRNKLFDIDSRMKFSLLAMGETASPAKAAFYLTDPAQAADPERSFDLSPSDISLMNPNTGTTPLFRSAKDAELSRKMYRAAPPLWLEERRDPSGAILRAECNPWGIEFDRMMDMTNDSHLFLEDPALGADPIPPLPLYEAKLIHHYDHRFATFDPNHAENATAAAADKKARDVLDAEKAQADFEIRPRYWVEKAEVDKALLAKSWNRQWLLGWRKITNATNERTLIASVMPRIATGDSMNLGFPDASPRKTACLLANISTLAFDFVVRQKIGGTNMCHFITKQLPVFTPDAYSAEDEAFLVPRVLELTFTSDAMAPWAKDLGYAGAPCPWSEPGRALLRAEIDAFFAKKYGLTRDELLYILDPQEAMGPDFPSETFPGLKRNDIAAFGEYRTKLLILEAWDRLYGR